MNAFNYISCGVIFAASLSGCGLITQDFTGELRVDLTMEDEDDIYSNIDVIDPNDFEDYRVNKDKIDQGQIRSVELHVIQVGENNNARYARGQVEFLRPGGDPTVDADWFEPVGIHGTVPVIRGNRFRLSLDEDERIRLNNMLFPDAGPIQLRVHGEADRGPVDFDVEVIVELEFSASL